VCLYIMHVNDLSGAQWFTV